MQDKKMKTEMILLAIPGEMLLEAGIFEGDPMQMYVEGNRIIIENLDDANDIICEGDCEACPIDMTDCDDDCESCPCKNICEYSEVRE